MNRGRLSLIFALALGPACGSDPPAVETDGATETGTAGSSGDADSTTGSADTRPDSSDGTTPGETGPEPDTSSSGPGSGTTEGCPAGTEGCPCGEGDTCDEGLICSVEGQCEPAPPCRPIDTEPNDDEATAPTLNELNCGDELDLGALGTLQGPEADWYRFFGDEGVILCSEQPRVSITAAIDPDVCVFIECLEGSTVDVTCAGGSTAADSPEGRPGCCGVSEAQIDSYDCSGFLVPKNVNIWTSITTAQAVCVDYEFVYSF